jgi:protein phosphatase
MAGRRTENEDRAATLDVGRGCLLAVVADGMGGANAGGVASAAAMAGFLSVAKSCAPGGERVLLERGFAAADALLREASQPGREGMGTTLVAAIVRGDAVWVGNIGDSRAVLVLPDEVVPLSEEHSVVGEELRAGRITEIEALQHPYRHAVSRAMGDGDHRPDLRFRSLRERRLRLRRGFVVLGTDGLFNHIGDAELLEIGASAASAHAFVHRAVLRAIQNGSDDNVTAAAVSLTRARPRGVDLALAVAAAVAALLILVEVISIT